MRAHAPKQATPAAYAPRPFRHLEIRSRPGLGAAPRCAARPRHPCDLKESILMATTTARRVRHAARPSESDRKNAAAALQRALDRRDNGGSTGH